MNFLNISLNSFKNTTLRIFTNLYTKISGKLENNICFYEPTYTGNARAIYDYIIKNNFHKKYKLNLLWIYTKNINLKKLYDGFVINSFSGFKKYLKCKIILASNVLFKKEKGVLKNEKTFHLLLWHGLPIKKLPPGEKPHGFNEFNNAIASSSYTSYLLASYLGIDVSKFVITGYPRNDKLLNKEYTDTALSKIKLIMNINNEYEKHIIYTPTFRPYNQDKYLNICNNEFNILNNYLKRNNYLLIIKYHINDELNNKINFLCENRYSNIKILKNETIIRNNIDFYDLLSGFDIMITDYSSIFNDFLLLDKPIIFYMPDLEKYYKYRGLIYPLNSLKYIMPGPIVRRIEEIPYHIENDDYFLDRLRMKSLIHEFVDGKSSDRVWKIIEANL